MKKLRSENLSIFLSVLDQWLLLKSTFKSNGLAKQILIPTCHPVDDVDQHAETLPEHHHVGLGRQSNRVFERMYAFVEEKTTNDGT